MKQLIIQAPKNSMQSDYQPKVRAGTCIAFNPSQEKRKMRFGIPQFRERVAPRCTKADSLMILDVSDGEVLHSHVVQSSIDLPIELVSALTENHVDILVCGGIDSETYAMIERHGVTIRSNIWDKVSEITEAISLETVPGGDENSTNDLKSLSRDDKNYGANTKLDGEILQPEENDLGVEFARLINKHRDRKMLSIASDISAENYRKLCRLSELVYFGIEMGFKRIGVAYCRELEHPATVLVRVLRRFFEVFPVPCSAVDDTEEQGENSACCNPLRQANILNAERTELNILVGLCVGADSLFNRYSAAPVTTLFVKDRALADNPIGAVYSEYYLNEVEQQF